MDSHPKVLSPNLHETQRFQMFEWLWLFIGLYKVRKEWTIYRYSPKVYFINLSRNLKISDGCLNRGTYHRALHIKVKKKICMDNLCDPKVHSITLSWNPRISNGYLNDGTCHWIHECITFSNKTTPLNHRVHHVNPSWNSKVSRVWRFRTPYKFHWNSAIIVEEKQVWDTVGAPQGVVRAIETF